MAAKTSKYIWFSITVAILVYTAVLTVRNLATMISLNHRIGLLEEQRDMYQARITEDSTMLERLNYDEFLEQYARERFHRKTSYLNPNYMRIRRWHGTIDLP